MIKLQISKNTPGASKPGNTGNKNNEQKNKAFIFGGVILVLLIAMIGYYVKLGIIKIPGGQKETASTQPKSSPPSVSVVSQSNNNTLTTQFSAPVSNNSISNIAPSNLIDPFSGPYNLSGVVVNDTGRNVAIIEGNGKTFVVAENSTIDNSWRVESVTMKQVILSCNNKRYALTMPDNTR